MSDKIGLYHLIDRNPVEINISNVERCMRTCGFNIEESDEGVSHILGAAVARLVSSGADENAATDVVVQLAKFVGRDMMLKEV